MTDEPISTYQYDRLKRFVKGGPSFVPFLRGIGANFRAPAEWISSVGLDSRLGYAAVLSPSPLANRQGARHSKGQRTKKGQDSQSHPAQSVIGNGKCHIAIDTSSRRVGFSATGVRSKQAISSA